MRNLSLCAKASVSIPNAHISATAVDLDRGALYVASAQCNPDNVGVALEIYRVGMNDGGDPSVLATFTAVAPIVENDSGSHIVSFKVIAETSMLSAILRCGDITMISLDDDESTVEVEGTVESGILAASWSPDDSLLVLTTGENKLILMTSTLDVLSEIPIHGEEFGEDAPINVGWGSKQTQFHGSLGKAAAQAPSITSVGCSPDDDIFPRVSWRGDGAFFVVSSLSPRDTCGAFRRILRVYNRQAVLQSTSESVAGQEHPLAWRPSGNLIASTQRFGFDGGGAGREGRHDVIFFERNGLRHGEFGLRPSELGIQTQPASETGVERKHRWGYRVRELNWSCDSSVLGVWIERDTGDVVQLWTTGNYHWYLKQEIAAPTSSTGSNRFTSVQWHPEAALTMILTTSSEVIQRTYTWEIYSSPTKPPMDTASVAVIDGLSIYLTPFRTQNIPPPMSSYQLHLPAASNSPSTNSIESLRTPIHVSFSFVEDVLAVLWETGRVELWNLQTRLESGRRKAMDPSKIWEGVIGEECRQVELRSTGVLDKDRPTVRIIVLGSAPAPDQCDILMLAEVEDGELARNSSIRMPRHSGRLVKSDNITVWQASDGELFEIDSHISAASSLVRFPEFCSESNRVSISALDPDKEHRTLDIGLAASGKLHILGVSSQVLESHVTSFTVTSSFVIFTTNSHEATFAPLVDLAAAVSSPDSRDIKNVASGWEKRRVERGSRIVTAVPSTMSLVLQMPRGNLETINPRPLVMEAVRQNLDMGSYRNAFLACRKHRIDLSVLVEHNKTVFFERLASFVEQVDDVDHINLFLTSVGRGSQPAQVTAQLCDAIRVELESRNLERYVNSILTAYVVKSPPDYESGLALLLGLRERNPRLVEDAVKYMIFLVDADKLFDTALGMYDFALVLMVAQHAQKDPREYLPFLRELKALDKNYQKFRIDDHLGRREMALRNLSLAGADHFEEAMEYMERHQLYQLGLTIWKGTDRYATVLDNYGNGLFHQRLYEKAALVFIEAEKPLKAMVALEKALQWQELFDMAARESVSEQDIINIGYRIAERLSSKKRYWESARVLLDYSKNLREAVVTLVQGNKFSEARRIITLHAAPELLVDIIHPGVLETRDQLADDINEMREQIRKQLHRICELRAKKTTEPDAFYGIEDASLHNVDVMTEVSMPATAFTRYTAAPSAASRTSKQTSRSKRKMERKIGSGRKGTVDEEEYLFKSVTKLVERFNTLQGEVTNILPHLYQLTSEHRREGALLQDDLEQLELELRDALGTMWAEPAGVDGGADTWASRMAEKEKEQLVDPSLRMAKPVLAVRGWGVDW